MHETYRGFGLAARPPNVVWPRPVSRHLRHASATATVLDLVAPPETPPVPGISTGFLIVLPYGGLFTYAAGAREWTISAAETLFVTQAQEFRDRHPVPGVGHASLVVKLDRACLDEVCGGGGATVHPAFKLGAALSTPKLQLLTEALLHNPENELARDELCVAAAREALRAEPRQCGRNSTRLVSSAKEYLHGRGADRVRLDEIASAIGVSPVYLTNSFKRTVGIPLCKYQARLRLRLALRRLPDTNDITDLALELGYSSHSHFTAAFRHAFGMSPSKYRRALAG